MTEPTVSKDGKFWWNGNKWIPFFTYEGPQPPPPTSVQNVNSGNPFASGMMGCLGVGAAIILVCILLFAGCSAMLSGARSGLNNATTQQSP